MFSGTGWVKNDTNIHFGPAYIKTLAAFPEARTKSVNPKYFNP